MSLRKLQEKVKNRKAWCAAVHWVTKSWTHDRQQTNILNKGIPKPAKNFKKSACVIRTVVIQSRQMKEVPVRHLSPYSGFGSYCTSFFVTKRKDMEQQWNSICLL